MRNVAKALDIAKDLDVATRKPLGVAKALDVAKPLDVAKLVMCTARLQAVSRAGPSFFGPGPAGPQRRLTKGLGPAQERSKPEPAAQAAAERLSATCLTCQFSATFFHCPSPLDPHLLPLTHHLPLDHRRRPSANKSQTLPP